MEDVGSDKHSSLLQLLVKKQLYRRVSWGRSHKTFWPKYTFSFFCKLDHFIAMKQVLCVLIKRSSFQKSVSKFMQKSFIRSATGANVIKLFTAVSYEFS
jgi:hypothetical protein